MKILIKNGHVLVPDQNIDAVMDLFVEDGVIKELGKGIEYPAGADTEVIDAKGYIVAPGLVDMHCHLREPGFEYKEDIESGAKSAVMGGFTSVACMPNTSPICDNAAVVKYILARGAEVGYANVYPIGAITKGQRGEELADIGEMKVAGVVAISDDGRPVMNALLMRRALEYSNMFETLVISHCEDLSLIDGGVMNEGYMSTYLGLKGITRASEEVMVSREIILSQTTKTPVHVAHVSTRGSVELIRQAKSRGVSVTCETCPHYFALSENAVEGFDTNAKVNPPLRSEDDVLAIKEGLADGTIDVIATDHAPHHIDEKNCEFEAAANGFVGFETALALGITELVNKKVLTLSELIGKMTSKPAEILGLNKGTLKAKSPADIVIFAPDEEYTVDVSRFYSKSKNSPFNNKVLNGVIKYTIVGGKTVVRQGVLV